MKCSSVDFKWEKIHDDFIIKEKEEIASKKEVPYNKIWGFIARRFKDVFNENVSVREIKNRDMELVNFSAQNKPFTESEKQLILEHVRLLEQTRSSSNKKMKNDSLFKELTKNKNASAKKRENIIFVDHTNHFTRSEESKIIKNKRFTHDLLNKKRIKFADLSKKFINLEENKSNSKNQFSNNSNCSEKIVLSDTNSNLDWLGLEQVNSSSDNTTSDPTITFQDTLLSNSQLPFDDQNDDFQIFLNTLDNENPISKEDLFMSELDNSTAQLDEDDQFFDSLLNIN